MTADEAVLALLCPKPDLSQLTGEPAGVLAAAQTAVDAPDGLGTVASCATEVALPATGTWSDPGRGGAQADIVVTASGDGVPLLFAEIGNCFESAQVLAAKTDKYTRFGQRKVKDLDGRERPMWRTRWWAPDGRHGDQPHPPPLLVFNRIGPRDPGTDIAQLAELTQRHWKGTAYEGGFHTYDGKLPIVVTGMEHLQEHGPAGAVFRRFGRPQNQTLLEAIDNPRREAHDARKHSARQQEYKEQPRRITAQEKAERGRPAVPCAPTAAPGSPTHGGRPSSPPGGAPRVRPTRTCATTASSAPSPPSVKPCRPGPSTSSTTRTCPSRRPAAPGSPASAADVRTQTTAGQDRPARPWRLLPGPRQRVPQGSEPVGRVGEELVHQPGRGPVRLLLIQIFRPSRDFPNQ
ncbi:hypothetical protein ACH4F6_30205 [Streptomyces sp. NPDC017936]|uniref:hypothetical protein n=1 Tax=Streptomyces sp. NPDC017936 TaxID=3365016 RepID=UPI00379C2882